MVFWDREAEPVMLSSGAFSEASIIYFEFKPSLTDIRDDVFNQVGKDGNGGLINRDFSHLVNLQTIGTRAFYHAFGLTDNGIILLPGDNLETIGGNAFRYNGQDIHGITGFIIGSPDHLCNKLNTIGPTAFESRGTNDYTVTVYTSDRSKAVWETLAGQIGGTISWPD